LQKLKFLLDTPSSSNALQARGRGVQFRMGSFEYLIALNCSGSTMVLRSNQTLTEMSVRRNSWSKNGWCIWVTGLNPSCADCLEILGAKIPGHVSANQA